MLRVLPTQTELAAPVCAGLFSFLPSQQGSASHQATKAFLETVLVASSWKARTVLWPQGSLSSWKRGKLKPAGPEVFMRWMTKYALSQVAT